MTKKWSDVAASSAFQALDSDQQEEARQQYFNDVVAPQVDPAEVDSVRSQFDGDTVAKTYSGPTSRGGPRGPQPGDKLSGTPMEQASQLAATKASPFGDINPEFVRSIEAAYDAATPEQRIAMAKRDGYVGQVASARAQSYASSDQAAADSWIKPPGMSSGQKLDRRVERRADRLIAEGVDAGAAPVIAQNAADFRVDPGQELTGNVSAYNGTFSDGPRTGMETATDLAGKLTSGAIEVPKGMVGLADLATTPLRLGIDAATGSDLPTLTQGLAALGLDFKQAQSILSNDWRSTAGKAEDQRISTAFDESLVKGLSQSFKDPVHVLEMALESAPGMAALAGGTRLAAVKVFENATKAAAVAGATEEAALIAGRAAVEKAMPKLANLSSLLEGAQTTGSAAADHAANGRLGWREAGADLAAGASTALIGKASNIVGAKLGLADAEAGLAAAGMRSRPGSTLSGVAADAGKGALKEGLLEEFPQSAGEQFFQNVADGNPLMQGVGRAGVEGGLVGGLMGAAGGGGAAVLNSNPVAGSAEGRAQTAQDNATDAWSAFGASIRNSQPAAPAAPPTPAAPQVDPQTAAAARQTLMEHAADAPALSRDQLQKDLDEATAHAATFAAQAGGPVDVQTRTVDVQTRTAEIAARMREEDVAVHGEDGADLKQVARMREKAAKRDAEARVYGQEQASSDLLLDANARVERAQSELDRLTRAQGARKILDRMDSGTPLTPEQHLEVQAAAARQDGSRGLIAGAADMPVAPAAKSAQEAPPAPTHTSFTPADSLPAQAGLTPIVVPNGAPNASSGNGTDQNAAAGSALPSLDTRGGLAAAGSVDVVGGGVGVPAGSPVVGSQQTQPVPGAAGEQLASVAPGGRTYPTQLASDSDLLVRVNATAPQNHNANPPAQNWYGRSGDGYLTVGDAQQAISGREKSHRDLDWKVEQMPSGKYQLAGYSRVEQSVSQANTSSLPEGASNVATDQQAQAAVSQPGSEVGQAAASAPLSATERAGLATALPAPQPVVHQVIASLSSQEGLTATVTPSAQVPDSHRIASVVARALGKTYTVMDLAGTSSATIGGFINRIGGDHLFASSQMEDAPLVVAMHEGLHGMPEHIRKPLESALNGLFDQSQAEHFKSSFGYSDTELGTEIPAKIAEAVASREDFWVQLKEQMGEHDFGAVAKHILAKFNDIIDKVTSRQGADFVSKYLGNNVVRARDLLTEAYAATARHASAQAQEQSDTQDSFDEIPYSRSQTGTDALQTQALDQQVAQGQPGMQASTRQESPQFQKNSAAPAINNEIHEKSLVIGRPQADSHVTEAGYTYRSVGAAELNAIRETGYALSPPGGKSRGGRLNTKHWSRGDGKMFYRKDQNVIRVRNESLHTDRAAAAADIESWNHETGSFEPISRPSSMQSANNRGSGEVAMSRRQETDRARDMKPGFRVEAGNSMGFRPALRVKVPGNPSLAPKPLFLATTTNKNAAKQISEIDGVLAKFPDATRSQTEWSRMMAYALGSDEVPVPPYAFIRDLNGAGAAEKLKRLSQGQIDDATHGFKNAAEFRRAYTSGELGVETTGKLFLWSFLSRGVSPYVQESLFIDSFKGANNWIAKAAAGELTESDFPAYEAWAKSVAPAGSGQPGAGATHNLNAFGQHFLFKMGRKGEDGKSHLQRLHDMMSDKDQTGQKIRREFASFGEGVGIDNKVVSFTLLVAGFNDVMVLDRVQIRQLWDDGRFNGTNLYDGVNDVNGKRVAGSSLNSLAEGARGILVYEAIERGLSDKIAEIYSALGRPQDASVGRYHWESWVADSQQEASHGTLGAILQDSKGDDLAIARVSAKQGEYGAYEYGARYNRDVNGVPWFGYRSASGADYEMSVPAFRAFLSDIKKSSFGVVPTKFKVSESGNEPWFKRQEVSAAKLDERARYWADRAGGSGEGGRAVAFSLRQKDVSDRAGAGAIRSESNGDGSGRGAGRSLAPLEGAPDVPGAAGPDPGLVKVAEAYAKSVGLKLTRQSQYAEVDPDRAARIAQAYDAMKHDPQDPRVQEAYADLIKQTTAQYKALEKAGYKFWFIDTDQPSNAQYASSPWNAMRDIRANKRMGVFPTTNGFGSGATDVDVSSNPLLADTGIKWPVGGPDGQLQPVLANDLFRAVHDAFGHGLEGSGFRAQGEENAWQAHARLFTGPALGALTSETRGQNSWLNYGPHGEKNRSAQVEDTVFADQKTGLMPDWTSQEGILDANDKIAFSRQKSPLGFYSELSRKLEDGPTIAMRDQWKGYIAGLKQKGVKPEEVEWSGINDWLELQTGKVSRQAVLDYVNANGVKVEETQLGGEVSKEELRKLAGAAIRKTLDAGGALDADAEDALDRYISGSSPRMESQDVALIDEKLREAGERSFVSDYIYTAKEDASPVKYDNYTLPGGTNYREVLLTLPQGKSQTELKDRLREIGDEMVDTTPVRYRELHAERAELAARFLGNAEGQYKSNHWDQPNVLAHIRLNDRVDADGKRVLFVEEIQSDWGQEGKKRGFGKKDGTRARTQRMRVAQVPESQRYTNRAGEEFSWGVFEDNGLVDGTYRTEQEASATLSIDGVPAAPFVQKTDAWVSLALKRVISIAVAEGYDRVAFVNGQQSSDRYDLSKQISKVEYEDNQTGGMRPASLAGEPGDGTLVAYNHSGKRVVDKYLRNPADAADHIGKELADRLFSAAPQSVSSAGIGVRRRSLSGLDLQVGGEGMKAFYDMILPKVAKDVLKRVGGGQMGSVQLAADKPYRVEDGDDNFVRSFATREEANRFIDDGYGEVLTYNPIQESKGVAAPVAQPGFDITDKMRDTVGETGVPMFSRRQQSAPVATGPARFFIPGETTAEAMRRTVQDAQLRVRKIQEVVAEQGGTITEQQDTYKAWELMPGRVESVVEKFDKEYVTKFIDVLAKTKVTPDEVSLYAYALHAAERNADIKAKNPLGILMGGGRDQRIVDAGSGMPNADAAAILAQVQAEGRQAQFTAANKALQDMVKTNRDAMLQYGLITQAEYAGIVGKYKNWVPLRGLESINHETDEFTPRKGKGLDIRGAETMAAMGRVSRASDILENVLTDFYKTATRGERNTVNRVLLDMVLSNPDASLWEVDPLTHVRQENAGTGLVDDHTKAETRTDVVALKVAGVPVYIRIKDPLMKRAVMEDWKKSGDPAITMRIMAGLNTLLRNTLTRYNPPFAAMNAVRDMQQAYSYILGEMGQKAAAKFMLHYPQALTAAGRHEFGLDGKQLKAAGVSLFGNPVMDAHYEEFLNSGAMTGGFYMKEVKDITTDIHRRLVKAGGAGSIRGAGDALAYALNTKMVAGVSPAQILKLVEAAGSVSENATRFALYHAARMSGATKAGAGSIAKNGTTNFNRKGEWGSTLSTLYLFAGAGIQGTRSGMHSLFKSKHRGQVAALAAGWAGLGMALAFWGAGAGGDDDNGEAYWDLISADEKRRNWIIMLPPGKSLFDGATRVGSRGRFVKIPMPYGWNVFPVMGMGIADAIRHKGNKLRGKSSANALLDVAGTVIDSANPIGGAVDVTNKHAMALAALPTFGDVPYEFLFDVNAFGAPTSPGYQAQGIPDREDVTAGQAGGWGHRTARWIYNVTDPLAKQIGSGEHFDGRGIDVKPGTLENSMYTLTGGTGRFVGDALSSALHLTDDQNPITPKNVPFLNKFYGEVADSQSTGKAYERARAATPFADLAKQEEDTDGEPRSAYEEAQLEVAEAAADFQKDMGALRKEQILLMGDATIPMPQRVKEANELRQEMDEIAQGFNSDWLGIMQDFHNADTTH